MKFHMAQDRIKLAAVVLMIRNIQYHQVREFSRLGEQVLASEEGLFLLHGISYMKTCNKGCVYE